MALILGLCVPKQKRVKVARNRLTGTKIFITAGEHDLTDNIVHLVLAKLPDAPAGPKGISLFLVPKFLVNDDGSLESETACTAAPSNTRWASRPLHMRYEF